MMENQTISYALSLDDPPEHIAYKDKSLLRMPRDITLDYPLAGLVPHRAATVGFPLHRDGVRVDGSLSSDTTNNVSRRKH
jgi:hypothetical protein